MTKRRARRLLWVGMAVCVVALALGVTKAALGPPHGVTEANVARIRRGMTVEEVDALLGVRNVGDWAGNGTVIWQSSGGQAVASLDEHARVWHAEFHPVPGAEPSLLDRIRAWLGW